MRQQQVHFKCLGPQASLARVPDGFRASLCALYKELKTKPDMLAETGESVESVLTEE